MKPIVLGLVLLLASRCSDGGANTRPIAVASPTRPDVQVREFSALRFSNAEAKSIEVLATDHPSTGYPYGDALALAPDGSLWFVSGEKSIERIDVSGAIQRFDVGDARTQVTALSVGSSGIVWIAAMPRDKPWGVSYASIASGVPKVLDIADTSGQSPFQIKAGRKVTWIATRIESRIWEIKPDGATRQFEIEPIAIAVDSKDGVWFVDSNGLGSIGADGRLARLELPARYKFTFRQTLSDVEVARNNSIWFSFLGPATLGRLDRFDRLRLYRIAIKGDFPPEIAPCSPDKVWFTSRNDNWIGLLDLSGRVVHFDIPSNFGHLSDIRAISCKQLVFVATFGTLKTNGQRIFRLSI